MALISKIEPPLIPAALLGVVAGYLIALRNEKIASRWKKYFFNFLMIFLFSMVTFFIFRPIVKGIVKEEPLNQTETLEIILKGADSQEFIKDKITDMTGKLFEYLWVFGWIGVLIRSNIRRAANNEDDVKPQKRIDFFILLMVAMLLIFFAFFIYNNYISP